METAQSLMERVYNYAVQIEDGTITACQKHKWAAIRFLDDINKIGFDEYEFYFDVAELYKFYKWAFLFKHTKGVVSGQRIELTDFQLFIAANIFCWKRKDNNLRRTRKVYIQLARKNAKSQLLALIASYTAFLSEEIEEAYIAGWGREQSSIVYNEILSQIQVVDFLHGKYSDAYGKIKHLKSGSVIQPLSKESRKTGDGKNPSVAILDEYHAHETSEIYDVLVSGMVARKNPLIVIITTAGFNINGPCKTEYDYVSKVLDPNQPQTNEEYFVLICELDQGDDIKDESNWAKANPIVSTYDEGIKFLRDELKIALDVPEKMTAFLTKNMNIWVNQRPNGYMNMEKWADCYEQFDFDLFRDSECIIGVDLSAKLDLTSVGFEFKTNDNYWVLSHSFMPEDTLAAKMRTDKVPYDLWTRQGWITLTPGGVVDYAFIKSFIENKVKEFNIIPVEICSDPWNASQFMQDMDAAGFTNVEIRQGIQTLGAPTKDFREKVYMGRVKHNGNPVLQFAVSNAVTKMDSNENIMLDKAKSTQRIDPIAALINAHTRSMMNINTKSVYEDRGLTML
jgi:phage terminase large subunit-like protein